MLASLCLLSLSPKMWITKSNLFWALHGLLHRIAPLCVTPRYCDYGNAAPNFVDRAGTTGGKHPTAAKTPQDRAAHAITPLRTRFSVYTSRCLSRPCRRREPVPRTSSRKRPPAGSAPACGTPRPPDLVRVRHTTQPRHALVFAKEFCTMALTTSNFSILPSLVSSVRRSMSHSG